MLRMLLLARDLYVQRLQIAYRDGTVMAIVANIYSAGVECNLVACDWYKHVSTSVPNSDKYLPTECDYSHIVISKISKHKNSNVYSKLEMVTQKVASPTHSSQKLSGQEQTRIVIECHCVHLLYKLACKCLLSRI